MPKRLGQSNPEVIARLVARPIQWLAQMTRPFVVFAFCLLPKACCACWACARRAEQAVTEEEIHAVLAEGTTSGAIEAHEHRMVRNLFRLDDRHISFADVCRAQTWCAWTFNVEF